MITCGSCGRTVEGEIADDSPCPTCGTPLLAGKPVEVDPDWAAEKAAKAGAHVAETAPKKRGGYIALMGVMVVMVGVIIVMITQRQPAVRGASLGDVQITITAPKPKTPVIVDGAIAGTTPLVMNLRSSKTPIKIVGNNVAIVIIPDRDRTVDLVPRKK